MRNIDIMLAGAAALALAGWAGTASAQGAEIRSVEDCARFATQQDRRDCAQDFVNRQQDDSDGPAVVVPDDDDRSGMGGAPGDDDDDDDDDGGRI